MSKAVRNIVSQIIEEFGTEKLYNIFKNNKYKKDVANSLNLPKTTASINIVNKLIKKLQINTDHFIQYKGHTGSKYKILKKICPVCDKSFETKKEPKKEKTYCSIQCSNTYLKSRFNREDDELSYRKICFKYHDEKCIICNEKLILDVHH